MAEHVADRQRDVALGENPRRELMEQRLNQVMIRPVDDGDFDLGAPQRLRRNESSESAADDHDVMPAACGRSVHCTTSLRAGSSMLKPPLLMELSCRDCQWWPAA